MHGLSQVFVRVLKLLRQHTGETGDLAAVRNSPDKTAVQLDTTGAQIEKG